MATVENVPLQQLAIVPVAEKDENDNDKTPLPSFLEFTSNIAIHGYPHVGSEKGCRRVLWSILFLGAIVFSGLMFRDAVKAYLDYAVYVEIEDFKFPQDDLNFPTITICNKVPLIKQSYERVKAIVDITQREFEEFYLRYFTRYRGKVSPNTHVEKKILAAMLRHNITTTRDAYELFEIGYSDMFENPLAKLFLNTRTGDPEYPTCRFDYNRRCVTKPVISIKESMCQQMNFFETGKAPRKGWRHKQNMFGNMIAVVNTATTERFKRVIDVRKTAPFMDLVEGLVVYIHQYGHMHENSPDIERIFLKPGKWNYVKIDFTEVRHLPPPYTYKCGTRPYKRINGTLFPYTKDMCRLDCQLDLKYKECGCIGWEFTGLVDLPVCNITQNHCFTNNRYYAKEICNMINKDCPNDCVFYRYNVDVETMDFIDDKVYDRATSIPGWKLNHSETENYINSNLVGIQVMFNNVARIESHHLSLVTWLALIGTIGGNLSLCAGFSIMVPFEFMQCAYDYLSIIIKRRKKDD